MDDKNASIVSVELKLVSKKIGELITAITQLRDALEKSAENKR